MRAGCSSAPLYSGVIWLAQRLASQDCGDALVSGPGAGRGFSRGASRRHPPCPHGGEARAGAVCVLAEGGLGTKPCAKKAQLPWMEPCRDGGSETPPPPPAPRTLGKQVPMVHAASVRAGAGSGPPQPPVTENPPQTGLSENKRRGGGRGEQKHVTVTRATRGGAHGRVPESGLGRAVPKEAAVPRRRKLRAWWKEPGVRAACLR